MRIRNGAVRNPLAVVEDIESSGNELAGLVPVIRKIEERRVEVPIFGELMPLRAEVEKLDALSGHADREEMLAWMKPIAAGLKKVFLVHGETDQQTAFAAAIRERYGLEAIAPQRGQSFDL